MNRAEVLVAGAGQSPEPLAKLLGPAVERLHPWAKVALAPDPGWVDVEMYHPSLEVLPEAQRWELTFHVVDTEVGEFAVMTSSAGIRYSVTLDREMAPIRELSTLVAQSRHKSA